MEAVLLYWLKANVVLALFGAAYYGLLRRLTFFGLNRAYLLLAVLFSAVYPLLPIPALLPASPVELPLAATRLPALASYSGTAAAPVGYAPYLLWGGLALYAAGAVALLARLLLQVLSLTWVRWQSRPATVLGQAVRVVPGTGGPFSFGSTIYFTASALADQATLPAAMRHEQAHVRQGHTFDVLLLQLATALAWPNPAAWLLRRASLDNLEYLADQATLRGTDLSRRAYQYLLLRQQAGAVPTPALAFRVEFFTLKNRIAMLSQPLSSRRQRGHYLLAALLVVGLALGYAGARAQPAGTAKHLLLADTTYYLDGLPSTRAAVEALHPEAIATMDVVQDPVVLQRCFDGATPDVVVITTQANVNSPAVLALQERADLASGYTFTPVGVAAVVPKALAYITSHYPDARLSGKVMLVKRKTTGAVKYQVELAQGIRPFHVCFTPQGDFLGTQL